MTAETLFDPDDHVEALTLARSLSARVRHLEATLRARRAEADAAVTAVADELGTENAAAALDLPAGNVDAAVYRTKIRRKAAR